MSIHIQAPSKYIQGNGELKNLHTYCALYTSNPAFVLVDSFIFQNFEKEIRSSFKDPNQVFFEVFKGECSKIEVDRVVNIAKEKNAGIIVGLGGGKTLDASKAVAYNMSLPIIIMPTAASSDAPTSALSVLYKENGEFDEYLLLKQNPNIVVVDTDIIKKAPVRLLVAGIGDALATYFEARACLRSGATTMAGGKVSQTGITLAKLCFDSLLENGLKAKLSVEEGLSSNALNQLIEANIYLSGIGFESGGLAAAHAIHDGMTCLEEVHSFLHGEKVAYGTLTQLVLENADLSEIEEVIYFCQEVGLPTTLAELGITSDVKDKLNRVAKATLTPKSTIHNMPFPVTEEDIVSAMLVVDKLGQH